MAIIDARYRGPHENEVLALGLQQMLERRKLEEERRRQEAQTWYRNALADGVNQQVAAERAVKMGLPPEMVYPEREVTPYEQLQLQVAEAEARDKLAALNTRAGVRGGIPTGGAPGQPGKIGFGQQQDNTIQGAMERFALRWQDFADRAPTGDEFELFQRALLTTKDEMRAMELVEGKLRMGAKEQAESDRAERRLPGLIRADEALTVQRHASAKASTQNTGLTADQKNAQLKALQADVNRAQSALDNAQKAFIKAKSERKSDEILNFLNDEMSKASHSYVVAKQKLQEYIGGMSTPKGETKDPLGLE